MDAVQRSEAAAWLIREALRGGDEAVLLTGLCERLEAAGHRPLRSFVAANILDPVLGGRGVRWNRGSPAVEDEFDRATYRSNNQDWTKSPFYALIEASEPVMRRRLDGSYRRGEFPLLDRFQDEGATDYIAVLVLVGPSLQLGDFQGLAASWTTDRPGGFDDSLPDTLHELAQPLGLALTLRTTGRIARTLLCTYLGSDAADEVLAGNVVRGQARSIEAVIWYSDLAGFTRITEAAGAQGALEFLNAYAEVLVDAIEGSGGHVLKFMGDGILAIFRDAPGSHRQALDAAETARRGLASLEVVRRAAGLPVSRWHAALHTGEVLYGNFGSTRRLDFTVLGRAVNEAARMEALGRTLDQQVVVSEAFAAGAGPLRERLVNLGRYAMKGVAKPQELFTLEPD